MPKIEAETANGLVALTFLKQETCPWIEDAGIDIRIAAEAMPVAPLAASQFLRRSRELGELERDRLAMEAELADNIRLSCQIRVKDDLKVQVVNQASVRGIDPGPRPFDDSRRQ